MSMQKRTVNQVLIYKLFLNDARFNMADLAAIGYSEDGLNQWMDSLKVDEWVDEMDIEDEGNVTKIQLKKNFKKGSTLELYNLDSSNEQFIYGIHTQWLNEEDLDKFKIEYPTIPIID